MLHINILLEIGTIAVTLSLSNESMHRYSYIKILKQRDN